MKDKKLIKFILSVLAIFSILIQSTGCYQITDEKLDNANGYQEKTEISQEYTHIPEHFSLILDEQDQVYETRIKELEDEDIYRCYKVSDSELCYIIRTYGYEEDMLVSVEIEADILEGENDGVSVQKVGVLFENESVKYGEYVTEDWFLDRFIMAIDEPIELVKHKKSQSNEVIAITGATITSQAIVVAVNKCIEKTEGKK